MKINEIDRAMMLVPPSAQSWVVEGPESIRFGWDNGYITKYGQKFSPWFFARNCAAVLGHVRSYGRSDLMDEMANYLLSIVRSHIESIDCYQYVVNRFNYSYLWHRMESPFYGAFMNNVTAFGLLHLFEATGNNSYLLLADRLLMTSVDQKSPIPLCSSDEKEGLWLHEYVFRTENNKASSIELKMQDNWCQARIYNGHIHALLPLMRIQAMTGTTLYDNQIQNTIAVMSEWLPLQIYDEAYFSYSIDMPIFPDYGQRRAVHLAESLGRLTNDPAIVKAAASARDLWEKIEKIEKEVIDDGVKAAKQQKFGLVKGNVS